MTPGELRQRRRDLGLTQAEMARRLNTPRRTYQNWEEGARRIPGIVEAALRCLAEDHDSTSP